MMREAFSLFDKDRDSRLKLVEFGTLLRYIGQNPSMAELLDLGNEIGKPGPKPGEKLIELQDFLNWVGSKSTSSDNLDDVIAALGDTEVLVPRRQTFYGMDEIFVMAPCGTLVGFAAPTPQR